MFNWGKIILCMTMTAGTLWIIKKFLGIFFEKKKQKVQTAALWAVLAVFQFYTEYRMNSALVVYVLAANVLLILAISASGYQRAGKIKIFYIVMLQVVWAIVEMFSFFLLKMTLEGYHGMHMLGSVVSKIIMIILVEILAQFWERKEYANIPTLYYLSFLFVPVGSIYVAIHEFNLAENSRKNFTSMVTFSILLLLNIVFLAIYTRLSENYTLEKEKIAYAQQMDMIARNTREHERILENFHAEKHDAINKLIVLKDELEHGKRENVLESLEKIISHIDVSESICQSGNSTVDALINFKYAAAKEQGVRFILKIFIPGTLPIDQCDLGVILGNSLDNAITAAAQCRNHEKLVRITIGVKKGALVIVVKNPYEQELKRNKTGSFLSTKSDSAGHGYGVGSIQKAAEKYNGEVLIETENHVFSIMIILSME